MLCLIGFLLLGGGNVCLVVCGEEPCPADWPRWCWRLFPLYVALAEMMLPGGEPLPARGWLGTMLGFAGLAVLLWPSVRSGLAGDRALLLAIATLLAGALAWTVGSILAGVRVCR